MDLLVWSAHSCPLAFDLDLAAEGIRYVSSVVELEEGLLCSQVLRSACLRASNAPISLSTNSDRRLGSDSTATRSQSSRHSSSFSFSFSFLIVMQESKASRLPNQNARRGPARFSKSLTLQALCAHPETSGGTHCTKIFHENTKPGRCLERFHQSPSNGPSPRFYQVCRVSNRAIHPGKVLRCLPQLKLALKSFAHAYAFFARSRSLPSLKRSSDSWRESFASPSESTCGWRSLP
jgi:hypothetical protein